MAHWPITLHDAIRVVLHECPDGTATTTYIAEQIIRRRLYVQKDGGDVFPDQIFLRALKYPRLFEARDRNTVRALPARRRKLDGRA